MMFLPLISKKEYEKKMRRVLVDQLYGGSVGQLLLNFVDSVELSEQDVQGLKRILDKTE